MHRTAHVYILTWTIILALARPSAAAVIEYTSFSSWQAVVGDFTTIDFTEFPKFTFITDQYEDLGVLFLDGDDNIQVNNNSFPPDMYGLDGNPSITMEFTVAHHWIGVTYPGVMGFQLYFQDQLIFTSGLFDDGGTPGAFAGLVSTEPFDRVVLDNTFPEVNIGDLYFGPPIPAPGAIGLLACAAWAPGGRRRRS